MTPIDKAIKALTEIVSECNNPGYPNEIVAERMIDRIQETAVICLSDLSSARLEAGDVEKLADLLHGRIAPLAIRHEDYRPAFLRILASLGQPGGAS